VYVQVHCSAAQEQSYRSELLRVAAIFGDQHLQLYTAAQAADVAYIYDDPTVSTGLHLCRCGLDVLYAMVLKCIMMFPSLGQVLVSSYSFSIVTGVLTASSSKQPLLAAGIALQEAARVVAATPLGNITDNNAAL
jgi:hypothetical protein